MREEMLVSAVPLTLTIERGASTGELHIIVEGFDPITVRGAGVILRPEGYGVVIERERKGRPE